MLFYVGFEGSVVSDLRAKRVMRIGKPQILHLPLDDFAGYTRILIKLIKL